jgi:penicillin-binding protein 1A
MFRLVRWLVHAGEFLLTCPYWAARFLFGTFIFNPRLGRLRLIVAPAMLYVLFAVLLTYVYAPIRGAMGQMWMAKVLTYADERSLGTAIYDVKGRFVGIIDPILDSEEDFNYTGRPIALPDYIAYPDHKSLHVGEVPEDYWQCLAYQEDRHLGGLINPFGIDLYGVLKIPVSTITRSFRHGSPNLGVGGSTLSMQLARIFFKTPPRADETAGEKLSRKLKEWWLGPVIQWRLTRGGDPLALKRWTANHFPLAQRTGGQELYGVEQTSLILFGKPARALSRAEQYVLAAAVNQPVMLIGGSEGLEKRRQATWSRVAGSRAKICATALIAGADERGRVVAELERLASAPPDPEPMPGTEEALAGLTQRNAGRVGANPVFRSNALLASVKYGVREELKARFGFGWRGKVGAVHLTLDAADNFRFREREKGTLALLDTRYKENLDPGYALDLDRAGEVEGQATAKFPAVIIAAADENGRLVRYFESNFNAAYFGSAAAREAKTGSYDMRRESRAIASLGKILAAVAIANQGTDIPSSRWVDTKSPATGLEACGHGEERRHRTARVAFACSLNTPLAWRTARVPLSELERLVHGFGITLADPVTSAANLAKSIVVGQVAASPRTVHRMAGSVLAALAGDGGKPMRFPSLVADLTLSDSEAKGADVNAGSIVPSTLVKPEARELLTAFLESPLCYKHGTLKRLSDWCAVRHKGVALHFAKTGTRGTGALDPAAFDTVDLWVAGGIKFDSGAAYSYVVLIGTGSPAQPWARDLYAGQVAEPLVRILLEDLEDDAAPAPKEVTDAR